MFTSSQSFSDMLMLVTGICFVTCFSFYAVHADWERLGDGFQKLDVSETIGIQRLCLNRIGWAEMCERPQSAD